MMTHSQKRLLERLTAAVGVLTFPLGVLTVVLLGWLPGLLVFAVGWFVLLPAFIVARDELDTEKRGATGYVN